MGSAKLSSFAVTFVHTFVTLHFLDNKMRKNLLQYAILSGLFLIILIIVSSNASKIACYTQKSLQKSNQIVLEKIPLILTLTADLDFSPVNMLSNEFELLITDTKIEQNTSVLPQWRYLAYQNFWLLKISFFQQNPNEAGYTYTYIYCLDKKLTVLDKILVHSKYDTNAKVNSYTEYQKSYIQNGYVLIEYKDVTITDNKHEYIRYYKLNKKGKFEKII